MKKILFAIIAFIILSGPAIAANAVCNGSDQLISTDANGNATCNASWGQYTVPSQSTLNSEMVAAASSQAKQNQQIISNSLVDNRVKSLSGVNWDAMDLLEVNGVNWTGIQALTNNSIAWTTYIIPEMNVKCSVVEANVNWTNWPTCEANGVAGDSAITVGSTNYSSGMTAFLCGNGAITGKC